jgi:hypothetical protein
VDHGGRGGHQDGARDPRRCVKQGGDPTQFEIPEFAFECNSKFRTTLYSN